MPYPDFLKKLTAKFDLNLAWISSDYFESLLLPHAVFTLTRLPR